MRTLPRLSPSLLCLLPALLAVSGPRAEEDVLWPQHPVHVDRSRQHYERLPAARTATDDRVWLDVPHKITIIDSARFAFDGKTYRLASIHPVASKRLCGNADGTKWTCGRAATILLNNLVRGKRLLCEIRPGERETLLERCQSGNRDVAEEIVGQGFGKVDPKGPLSGPQILARKRKAGLWRNPGCALDFDRC